MNDSHEGEPKLLKLSVVIVNTNEWHVLEGCLKSVFEQTQRIDFEVIVVDNASSDGSREKIRAAFPLVNVLANDQNLGFAAANNRGIAKAKGQYVLLLNPDTVTLGRALEKLVSFLEMHPDAGIVGCKLLFPDRSLQRTARSFATVTNLLWETLFFTALFPRSRTFGRYNLGYFDYDRDLEVDWLLGACLMIRRKVIEIVGLLDEQFYMYTEEVDYCYRTKLAGFGVWFTPRAEILHFWNGMNAFNRRVLFWTLGSQMLFFQKHFSGLQRYLLVLLKYLGTLNRVILYFLVGCVSFNKRMINKAYCFWYAIYRFHTYRWRYERNFDGEVVPWPRS